MAADFLAVTIGVGEPHCRLAELAAERMRRFSGLDVRILGDAEVRQTGVRDPNHLKFHLFDFANAENVLYFDSDAFCLRPWNPRQFEDSASWVAVRGFWFDAQVQRLGRTYGFGDDIIQGGWFLCNRTRHARVLRLAQALQPPDDRFDGFFNIDEIALSTALNRLDVPVRFLDRRYDWLQYGRGDLWHRAGVVIGHACDGNLRHDYLWGDLPEQPPAAPAVEFFDRSYWYRREGYDERLLEFRSDGTIGAGGGDAERYWFVRPDAAGRYLVIGSVHDETCTLTEEAAGGWRGRWRRYEQMPVTLLPMAEPDEKHISATGCWLDGSPEGHYADPPLADALAEFFAGQSVVDFGCGRGDYVARLRERTIDCAGYDGNPHTPALSGGRCGVLDLARPCDLNRQYDWVLSLEVGEHIPPAFEAMFLDNLARHAQVGIVLSWAVVGQGGRGHCNERNNDEVRRRLAERQYTSDLQTERTLREASTLDWFQQTLMVFRKQTV